METYRIRNAITTTLAATFTVASLALLGTATAIALTPCPTEDSSFCRWDANYQGNGEGTSFLSTWEEGPLFQLP